MKAASESLNYSRARWNLLEKEAKFKVSFVEIVISLSLLLPLKHKMYLIFLSALMLECFQFLK